MIYHCDRCRAILPGGTKTCPQCGREFESPVPFDWAGPGTRPPDDSVDAVLRNRTASRDRTSTPGSSEPSPTPAWYGAAPKPRQSARKMPLWPFVTVGLIAVVALIGWGASTLWMRGAGGELAFRQHNSAGNAAAERGNFAKADDEYGQMIALRPNRVDGYLLRAINETLEGQPIAAIHDNTTALGLTQEPMTRGNLLYNRAEAREKMGAVTKAIADFTLANAEFLKVRDPRLLARVPDFREDVYRMRAYAYWQHKDYALSISDSKAAIALGPVHPDDYGVQAKAEAALGRDQAAQADFNQALRSDPDYLDGYIGLAGLAEKHHQYAQALASDRHSQALDPNQGWVNYNTALTYAATGQGALAHTAYAIALSTGTAVDQKAGMTDLRNALAKQPGSAVLHQALAQVQQGSVGGPRSARSLPPPPPLPAAKPPAPPSQFAAQLAPEVIVSGCGIQPPRGYTLTQRQQVTLSGTSTVYLWSGPRRDDGTVPTLQAVIGQDDGSLAAHSSQHQVAQDALADMGSNHSNLTVSAVSALTLGTLSFDGGDWDGIGQQTGKEYKGSEYWSVTPSHIIHLSTHDAVPYSQATLPLLKASMLTFRRI